MQILTNVDAERRRRHGTEPYRCLCGNVGPHTHQTEQDNGSETRSKRAKKPSSGHSS